VRRCGGAHPAFPAQKPIEGILMSELRATFQWGRTLCAIALVLSASAAGAAEKITIMVGGFEKQIYLPAKLAERLGYFKAEGLDIELLNETSGVNAENEMLAGAVHGVVGFYDHCVDLQTKGKAVQSVVQFSQAPGEVELVSTAHPEIKTMADLRGKSLGVTGLGSSTNFLTQYIMVRAGVPLSEFSTLPVGAGTTFIQAMKQDKIQAGMTTEPTITHMLNAGEARVLVDMRTVEKTRQALGGTYPAASLYMSTEWIEKNKPTVQKLANAFVKTLKYINSHSAAEIAEQMPRDFYAGDKEGYVKALAEGKGMFTPDGVMPVGGPETVLAVLSEFSKNVKGKKVDLSKTYTTEFVKNAK
jgi:NitT/TauT family transport system substrate-binding protein